MIVALPGLFSYLFFSNTTKWDLAFVLSTLCKESYETLSKASLIHLTMKTSFLLTMATARRVSEVHALAIDEEHLRFRAVDGSLTVRTRGLLI